MTSKVYGADISCCVCYLSPDYSTRNINPCAFLDDLTQIYMYQNDDLYCVCGDCNARSGQEEDVIEGIDLVLPRDVVDFTSNSYGKVFTIFSSMLTVVF